MGEDILQSPWIHQLARKRPLKKLTGAPEAEVVIVGAGIAGVSTAYFLLTRTKKELLLIEGDRVAHGATGHNAGQLVSYFERPFHDLVREYGRTLAAEGQRAVESSWKWLESMREELDLKTPCHIFRGYAGCQDLPTLLSHLKDNAEKIRSGLTVEEVFVAKEFQDLSRIPRAFHSLYHIVPQKDLLAILETKDPSFIAALAGKKGCMNSAAFTEEVVLALLKRFPKRLRLVEGMPISRIELNKDQATLFSGRRRIQAGHVVLCTNGFERLTIKNTHGSDIDTKFHHLVRGSIGYMAGFLEDSSRAPTAVSYLPAFNSRLGTYDTDPYFYLTRRPYEVRGSIKQKNLICIGGPEVLLDDTNRYQHASHPYPSYAKEEIFAFIKRSYPKRKTPHTLSYIWHGLMGYTPNGLRCVGSEPCNPVLLYNLGCNGVGILPSVFGGFRISQILNGESVPPSIFDPEDQRCVLPQTERKDASTVWAERLVMSGCVMAVLLATVYLLLHLFLR